MKLLWTGTDALYQVSFPPFISFRVRLKILYQRILIKLINRYIQEHYVDSNLQKYELEKIGFKNIKVVKDVLKHTKKMQKQDHDWFNVLYYYPLREENFKNKKLIDWIYGKDIFDELVERIDGVSWLIVDGTQDMTEVFPITDFYVRPNRHDGASRLRQECKINDIPYYWSQQQPNTNEIIAKINDAKKN